MKVKKIRVIILFLTMFFSTQLVKAQFPIDTATGKVSYTDVIEFTGYSKEKIYKKAKTWVVSTFKSADVMSELDDVNMDNLVATGTVIVDSLRLPYWGKYYATNTYINFKFKVLFKDGKVKYYIENILLSYTVGNTTTETGLEAIKPGKSDWTKGMKAEFDKYVFESVNKTIMIMISNFTKSLKTEENNNW